MALEHTRHKGALSTKPFIWLWLGLGLLVSRQIGRASYLLEDGTRWHTSHLCKVAAPTPVFPQSSGNLPHTFLPTGTGNCNTSGWQARLRPLFASTPCFPYQAHNFTHTTVSGPFRSMSGLFLPTTSVYQIPARSLEILCLSFFQQERFLHWTRRRILAHSNWLYMPYFK